ncbi:hypothetical protein WICPIJ_007288 [Wickerhamomyces pijperi]|uniref:T6SS Phospholipase effector Tle1-like catalytic domain-containing protein n=1 Tax=Wickerhamomyces pijperi TaxID=599730 RepID=A0A9P8Q076_WICPI|nr:hypothetical protein WICPIJ_007288 [Wickerhamomyces pijperi]
MKNIIICLDGTDSKFGPAPYTNLLKLFRLLDKNDSEKQVCYYQSGIGTSMSTESGSPSGGVVETFLNLVDSLIAFSLDQHVIEAYRFLIKFYSPGDLIYIYGFSRGAFSARVLSSMIERIGLLHQGLEELAPSAWRIYCAWEFAMQPSQPDYTTTLIEEFRSTFSRKEVPTIRLLGLFDCVNSVGFIRDRLFPFTSKLTHIDQIRHAVSLDERRCKYKQSLIYPHSYKTHLFSLKSTPIPNSIESSMATTLVNASETSTKPTTIAPPSDTYNSNSVADSGTPISNEPGKLQEVKKIIKDIESRLSQLRPEQGRSDSSLGKKFFARYRFSDSACSLSTELDKTKLIEGDFQEQWFPGNHSDIGAGWFPDVNGQFISNVPLRWMLSESIKLGVIFDKPQLVAFGTRYTSLDSFLSCRHDYLSLKDGGLTHILTEKERTEILQMSTDSKYRNCKSSTRPYFRSLSVPKNNSFEEMFNNGVPLQSLKKYQWHSTAEGSEVAIFKSIDERNQQSPSSDPRKITILDSSLTDIAKLFQFWKQPPKEPIMGFDGRGGLSLVYVILFWFLELIPFGSKVEDPSGEWKYVYIPNLGRSRSLPNYSTMHWSTLWRMRYCKGYKPDNLPSYVVDLLQGKEVATENELIRLSAETLQKNLIKWKDEDWLKVPDELKDVMETYNYI